MILVQADASNLPFKANYFHAVITSPPYYGLRTYEGDQGNIPLGLEPTWQEHIDNLVDCFRQVRRVLRDDGVLWVNYDDSYATTPNGRPADENNADPADDRTFRDKPIDTSKMFEPGSLMLLPQRLAIALQEDGWIVRCDVIWRKPNPMPASVNGWRWEQKRIEKERHKGQSKQAASHPGSWESPLSGGKDLVEWEYLDDLTLRKGSWRPTRQHEYILQCTKQMGYYCDHEAMQEPSESNYYDRYKRDRGRMKDNEYMQEGSGYTPGDSFGTAGDTRNPRSILTVPSKPYSGAHYATFPPDLIEPWIRASVPKKCCAECGSPWAPVVIREPNQRHETENRDQKTWGEGAHRSKHAEPPGKVVAGYKPTCEHGDEWVPGRVLDIFGGSGTVGMVAKEMLRDWVVMDIARPYLDEQAKLRTGSGTPSNALEGLPLFEGSE